MRSRRAALALLLVLTAACSSGGEDATDECGFPSSDPAARAELIPEELLLDGEAQVSSAGRRKGGVTAALRVQLSVQDALPLYKQAVTDAGFDIVGGDNEGFEAEVYIKKGKELGQVQIRRSLCADASVVFVNLVTGDFAMPIVTTPSPSAP